MLEKEKENKNAHLSVFHLGALGIKNLKIKLKRLSCSKHELELKVLIKSTCPKTGELVYK